MSDIFVVIYRGKRQGPGVGDKGKRKEKRVKSKEGRGLRLKD